MTPARWLQVKDVFDRVIDAAPEHRDALLESLCGSDSELRAEVQSLLSSHQADDELLDHPAAEHFPGDPLEGRRLGPYKIIREIGRGGMGSVYLGLRDDDQFRRRVAIKVVKHDVLDSDSLRRFERERETLAFLEHPNIVMLLDGGTADDGTPYLVMDYVEGVPIDRYCETNGLSVAERLQLFRKVCAAVHYAHQNLVIHRDLKPANIIVTAEGVPKLLDFGIAKLIRPEYSGKSMGLTRTEFQPLTPDWASPEQVLGHPVTTAADVYSLGAVLYKLLTSHHPFEDHSRSVFEMEQAVATADPSRPSERVRHRHDATAKPAASALSRRLRGDLDTIVMKAMRKEPQRRYASAEHLSEDVRRHLEGLPVIARGDSVLYRASKFAARHRTGVAAAVLAVMALSITAVVAHSQRLRAERRFNDLRQFANFVLNDLDESLRSEGLTPARRKVVSQALQYLDSLAREASGNEALQQELVNGYVKTGDVQGNAYEASLGDSESALASYRKALNIAAALSRERPNDPTRRARVADVTVRIADIQALQGSHAEAARNYDDALRVYSESLQAQPQDKAALHKVLEACVQAGSTREQAGDVPAALDSFRKCLVFAQRLFAVDPSARGAVALVRERMAFLAARSGQNAGAEEDMQASLAIYRQAALETPGRRTQRNLAKGYKILAEVQHSAGKDADALASARESIRLTDDLLQRDPRDKQLQIDLHMALVLLIDLLESTGDSAAAKAATARAIAFLAPLVEVAEPSLYDVQDYALLLVTTPFPEFRNDAAALRYSNMAVQMTARKDPESLDLLARALERNASPAEAVSAEREALALIPSARLGGVDPEPRKSMQSNLTRFVNAASADPPPQAQR